jgi:aminoglycoside phosphotransferase (APT) family kinase protein
VSVPTAIGLPRRDRPIGGVDFDRLRALAPVQELLVRAEHARNTYRPQSTDGSVHGDLWQGNSMWNGDRLTALIDWDCAGIGPAGVDLGSLRCDAGLCFDVAAIGDVPQAGRTKPVTPLLTSLTGMLLPR